MSGSDIDDMDDDGEPYTFLEILFGGKFGTFLLLAVGLVLVALLVWLIYVCCSAEHDCYTSQGPGGMTGERKCFVLREVRPKFVTIRRNDVDEESYRIIQAYDTIRLEQMASGYADESAYNPNYLYPRATGPPPSFYP